MIQVRDGKICIHTSDRIMYRRCKRKAYLASRLWLGLQPVKPNSTLWLGSGVHKGIEMFYGYRQDPVQVFNEWAAEGLERIRQTEGLLHEEKAKYDEMMELGRGMLEHYKQFAQQYDDFNVYVFPDGRPAVEILFEVPILDPQGNHLHAYFDQPVEGMDEEQLSDLEADGIAAVPVYYRGRIDLIVEDIYGDLWIFDHKTCKTFGDWSKLQLDTQVGSYIWALKKLVPDLNKHVRGVIYNGLKKAVPKPPEPLVRGGFSKNKNQSTTYEVYLATLLEHGEDPAKYQDILEHLKEQTEITENSITNKFFKRQKVKRSPAEIENIGLTIYYEAIDMIQTQFFYHNPTRDCSWDCDFYDVCVGMNNNEDVDWMLETLYERRAEEDTSAVFAWEQEV